MTSDSVPLLIASLDLRGNRVASSSGVGCDMIRRGISFISVSLMDPYIWIEIHEIHYSALVVAGPLVT